MSFHITGLRRHVAVATVLLLAVLSTPLVSGTAPAGASTAGSAVRVKGPNRAYDTVHDRSRKALPSVRVSQTRNLVDQTIHVSWTDETPSLNDEYDTKPNSSITYQPGNTYYAVGVFECKGAHPTNFTKQCFLAAAGSTAGDGGLGNAVDTITYANGSGFADLHVETGVTNSDLLCDSTHPCSVAVVPAWGGQPLDANTQAPAQCNNHTNDLPNANNGYNATEIPNSFNIGVQPCSWANRITVPLHFKKTPQNCPSSDGDFTAAGSPMLERAMAQWQAGWCNQKTPVTLDYNSTNSEYEARDAFAGGSGALTSATDMALTTQPVAGKAHGYTYAPIANTDIAVAFLIDNAQTHQEITDITLDARLVAKMLTQSYSPLAYACLSGGNLTKQSATCDPAVRGNPQSILQDPEFLKLNPQLKATDFPHVGNDAFGAFFPTVVAGDSDLTYELTRYVGSDPQARAFLAGKKDPWGMHVNTYYQGIHYPTSQLAELDPGYTDPANTTQPGTGTMQNTWQPVSGLDQVGQLLVGNSSTSLNNTPPCSQPPCSLPKLTEYFGARNLFAIMDQGQASAYNFPTARLVNGAGRAVAPSPQSVRAGVGAATTNSDGITQRPDFTSRVKAAYPLSVTDYAMVHTCGQSAKVAGAVAGMLGKVASSQRNGVTPGTIAAGYLGLTRTQLTQLTAARRAVGSSSCSGTEAKTTKKQQHHTATNTGTTHNGNGSNPNDSGGGNGLGSTGGDTTAPSSTAPSSSASGGSSTSASSSPSAAPTAEPVAFNQHPDSSGPARFTLPILLAVGGLLLVGGPLAYALMSGAGAGVLGRVRGMRS